MIVPMKKVTLIMRGDEKRQALKKLRRLGLVHIEETEGSGERLRTLTESSDKLERAILAVSDRTKKDSPAEHSDPLETADRILALSDEKKACTVRLSILNAELERLRSWGEVSPEELSALAEKGISLSLYEMQPKEFKRLDGISTIVLGKTKRSVRFVTVNGSESAIPETYRVKLPQSSTAELKKEAESIRLHLGEIERELDRFASCTESMKTACASLQKEIKLEVYTTGMSSEELTESTEKPFSIAYLTGFIPTEELDKLKASARESSWGLISEDPTEEDNVPTKLKNNRLVSLIYPLTDFLGTVPGYFEYDISGWFLGFILVFFGIIFGDGGYGLLICAVAAALIFKAKASGKQVPAAYLLVMLLGAATVLWGVLTCTWFGISPDKLPVFLRKISLPIISNVNADRIWYPFWTGGEAGLTTSQNVQVFCFALALVQLSAAHIMGAIKNRRSLKALSDIGSALQLFGMFYVVMALVVNGEVFSLGLVVGGIPVGSTAIALVGIGFAMSFVFANYEGSIGRSVLDSLKNIVSVLLGVVNVFSDIVSYIRLWAVGLAGAAISATVNDLAGPLFGNLLFIALAIILLVFGHGLNMILNILSVIVHGVRLNTLEFSSHLDMSWSGHKYEPFEE